MIELIFFESIDMMSTGLHKQGVLCENSTFERRAASQGCFQKFPAKSCIRLYAMNGAQANNDTRQASCSPFPRLFRTTC